MDPVSMNRYEKQLYTVFKTFDVNNEESLDRPSVLALCDALQLEHRGAALADTLFERRADRVTFTQFRNGLLEVLGAPPTVPAPPAQPPDPDAGVQPPEAHHSDDDSSGREVAPKIVFGSKKYGRRSRPSRSAAPEAPTQRSSSASRLDNDSGTERRPRGRRSASAMENREEETDAFEHDRRIDREDALALCRRLDMDAVDRSLVNRIFDETSAADTTVGEFFDRLDAYLTISIEEASRESPGTADDLDSSDDEAAPAELVLDALRRARVPRAHLLLARLGFRAPRVRLARLQRALDELSTSDETVDEQQAPLAAALAITRLRLEATRRRASAAVAERDKLRADVAETNRRAALLAQEVDESHARLEAELQATLRRAEARHADASRRAAADAATERERAAAAMARLEAEEMRRAEAETRARISVDEARERARELEARVADAEGRAAEVERERKRLEEELGAAEARAAGAGGSVLADELAAALEEARRESAALRDRCDELCAALEARGRPQPSPGLAPPLRAELHEQEEGSSPGSLESGLTTAEVDVSVQTDALTDVVDEEKDRLAVVVNELETSLEAMREEYERCEEYWSGKLREERALLAEEQRASDQRLAELLARVADYERQYASALPPIDERAQLEAQVTDLQDECARRVRRARDELAARDVELERRAALLQRAEEEAAREAAARVAAERRLAAGREAARALATRTARAEAAARALASRLAAADLLVKELFVETCQRAARAPL